MKIKILADLHNEFTPFAEKGGDYEAVILAGDTDIGTRGAEWAMETYKDIPVIYVAGNHEYYSKKISEVNGQLKFLSVGGNLKFLENEEFIYNNVRFLGCTLWTDFLLFGMERLPFVLHEVTEVMNDFKKIRMGPEAGYRRLNAGDTMRFFKNSVRFLEEKLKEPFEGQTIIITHHSPSDKIVFEEAKEELIIAAFCSNLEWLIMKYRPYLWIHGHYHARADYMIGDTRIICNPRGYDPYELVKGFREDFVVEV